MQEKLLQTILSDLNNTSPDIVSSAVISTDGLPISYLSSYDMDPDRIGAMSAALLALSSQTSKEMKCDELEQVIIKGSKGYILLIQAGDKKVLAVTANQDARLGLILIDAKRAVRNIVDSAD